MKNFLGLATGLLLATALAGCSSEPAPSPANDSASDGGTTPAPSSSSPAPSTSGTTTAPPASTWTPPVVATTSAACGGAAMPQAVGATYTTPSGRTYHVWGPSTYDPSKTYPVVMTFHGMDTDGPSFEAWFQMEDYVNDEAFVVYPDAVNGLWDLDGTTDLVFFDDMVKQLGATYCIDPSHILGFGFSYGAKFMNNLGCKRAGYVKALMMGDGSDGGDYLNCGLLPILETTRTLDTNELPAWGEANSEKWATLEGCTANATQPGDATLNCITHQGCQLPGAVTYCEDTYAYPPDTPGYDETWNHTVREPYRAYAWEWFKALP